MVVFTLSGRIDLEHVADLQALLDAEMEAVGLLARAEADGRRLANCPAYIREWILTESGRS